MNSPTPTPETEFKKTIVLMMTINAIISTGDRASQIIYFATTTFMNDSIRNTCIAFVIIKTLSHIIMMAFYLLTYTGKKVIDANQKYKFFWMYVASAEINFSIGAHKTFETEWDDVDNIIVTQKFLNAIHFVFVSIPQLLIVSIHSSGLGKFATIDIISLSFSCAFIVWSVIYYLICTKKEDDWYSDLQMMVAS